MSEVRQMRYFYRVLRAALATCVMASGADAARSTAVPAESKKAEASGPAHASIGTVERPQTRRPAYLNCENGCLYSNGTWRRPPAVPTKASSAPGPR